MQGKRASDEVVNHAVALYESGLSSTEVAKEIGYSASGAKYLLRRAGVIFRNHGPRPGKHNKVLKKRKIDSRGYILVWVDEESLFRENADARGYVAQHRLIMAESIGRPLIKGEHVHHINGNKTDNRIQNLQLMRIGHAAGVRLQCQKCQSYDVMPIALGELND